MDEQTADLAALNQKLDVLSVQVNYLIEQAQETARRQRERSELLRDALPIANEALGLVTEQLDEIQEYIDLSDILSLFKRLLRNGRNIDTMLDQLEGVMDLAATAGPLANSVFEKVTDQLEVAEHRGYFALAKGGARAVDRVASSLTPGDLDCMANNAVVLLAAFQGLCDPVEQPTMRTLLRQMRDPDTRRGLTVMLRMLRAIGAQAAARGQAGTAAAMGTDE
jgi:uncharacterized protein YjgD (DUF1641 family)